MQITLHTEELNAEQLGYLEAIIRVKKEKQWHYEGGAKVSMNTSSPEQIDSVKEQVEDRPTEEPLNPITPVGETPKRTRRTKAEIEAESVQIPEEASEVVEEEPVVSDAVSLTLSDIKTKAQELVTKVSRDAVKNAINEYADKISEVKESDYSALMADFEALEKTK